MLYCFLDTNIFIHYQDIKDIDWNAELGASKVCLVIAPVIFEELDEFKDNPRDDRKRNRARRTIRFLESALDSPDKVLRKGVTLDYAEDMQAIEFIEYNLSSNNNDDRLVASMVWWSQKRTEKDLILVSHDSGPRIKAKRLGFRAQELSKKYRLPDQVDPKTKEIQKLRTENLRIQSSQARLQLGFADSSGAIVPRLRAKVERPSDSVIERLTRRPLTTLLKRRPFQNEYVLLLLTLQNSGDVMAAGVEISLEIRGQVEARRMIPANVLLNTVRILYRTTTQITGSRRTIARMKESLYGKWKCVSVESDVNTLRFQIESVKPHDSVELDPIYLMLGTQQATIENVALQYDILKDSPGPRQHGDLHVILNED